MPDHEIIQVDCSSIISAAGAIHCAMKHVHTSMIPLLISGHILDADGIPVEGISVSADNGGGSDTTDPDGYYELLVSYNWSGTVTPTKPEYTFDPNSKSYTNVTADTQNQDYTATYTPDYDPPTPDPMAWTSAPIATGPYSVTMTAATASDSSGVEYYFACVVVGGHDSGWQDSPLYEDTGLTPDTNYAYQIKARDKSANQNETAWSTEESATTEPGPLLQDDFETDFGNWTNVSGDKDDWYRNQGSTPSSSTGPNHDNTIGDSTGYYIYMETSSGYCYSSGDEARLESPDLDADAYSMDISFYYHMYGSNMGTLNVDVYDGAWHNGVWSVSGQQHSSSGAAYTQATVDLDAYTGTIKIRFRGVAAGSYRGDMAVDDIEITAAPRVQDTDPPTPDPMTWATVPHATSSTSVLMTATPASDDSGVEYYFACVAGGGHDSGWQNGTIYEDTALTPNTQYTYQVKARDKSTNQNETASSATLSATTYAQVPSVVGLPQANAEGNIIAAGLAIGNVTNAYSDTVPQGNVISQNPTGGSSVPPATAVDLVVSLGVQMVIVPDVVGQPQTAAEASIIAAGLVVGNVTNAYSDTVPAGNVISQNPTGGTEAAIGSAVDIVVSLGRPVVPDVVGMTQADATAAITAVDNLTVNVTNEYSDTVPAGSVISQNPAGGTEVPTGSVVNIVISLGPQPDTTPPTPNPMTWASAPVATGPYSIAMMATAASDDSGVEYYFACTTGAGHDSGWQDSATYEDTGLSPDTQYTYQVKARDKSPNNNETNWSGSASAITEPLPADTTPPTPDSMTWATVPHATGTISISMTATTASDASGVEYYFECTAGAGHDSGWRDTTTYEDTGLAPGTQYTYQVKARDKSLNQNETAWSSAASAITQSVSYCTASGDNASEEWIARLQLADIDNGFGSNGGYADFTNISTNLVKTTAYPITLTPEFAGTIYNEYWRVWIDLNHDGDFEDSTELVFDAGSVSKSTVYGDITIPSDAALGAARMRVVMRYNTAPSPCGSFNYGEVEDYTVNIVSPAPDTTPPTPNPMTWATPPHATGSTSISMTAATASDTSGVQYYFVCTAGAGHDSGWQNSTIYEDTGLSPETQYTYRVKARDKSANHNKTGWSSSASATTAAPSEWTELTYDDFESGWGNYTDGGGDCRRYTAGTYAHQGSFAANIQDNSGTSSSFYYTNGIDVHTPGYSQLKVEFWFYPRSMESGEDFWVQYYDGSNWHTVAGYARGSDFSNDVFYNKTVYINETDYTFPTAMKLRFMCDASANYDDIYIDEIRVSAK